MGRSIPGCTLEKNSAMVKAMFTESHESKDRSLVALDSSYRGRIAL
jgi:hypothetical protein